MYYIVAIIQLILHYLGWVGIIYGIIALIFGNISRSKELLIGGISFLAIKYIIGFVYLRLAKSPIEESKEQKKKLVNYRLDHKAMTDIQGGINI